MSHKNLSKREIRHAMYGENARNVIGGIEPGMNVYCLTKGQFSIINVLEHLLTQTGPADLLISTWTAANAEIQKAWEFLGNGNINNLRWIVDGSFKTRQRQYYQKLVNTFGENTVAETDTHCKYMLISNDSWRIVVRTSMNLNENKRMEYVEISDDPALFEYMMTVSEEVMDTPYSWENFKQLGQDEKYSQYRPNKQKADSSVLDALEGL